MIGRGRPTAGRATRGSTSRTANGAAHCTAATYRILGNEIDVERLPAGFLVRQMIPVQDTITEPFSDLIGAKLLQVREHKRWTKGKRRVIDGLKLLFKEAQVHIVCD